MKINNFLENLQTVAEIQNSGIHHSIITAYREAKDRDLEYLDLSGCIQDCWVEEITDSLRKCQIGTITISSGYSGMVETLYRFEQNGCKLVGMTTIHSQLKNWDTDEFDFIPALVLKVGFKD